MWATSRETSSLCVRHVLLILDACTGCMTACWRYTLRMQAYWRSVFTTYVKHLADTYVRPMHEPMQCGRVLNTYDSHVLHPYIPDTADVCVPTITWAVFVTYTSHVECTHTFQKCRHISAVHIGRRISHVYFSHRVDTYIRPRHTVKPAPYMVRMESLYVQYVNGLVICADCIMTVYGP